MEVSEVDGRSESGGSVPLVVEAGREDLGSDSDWAPGFSSDGETTALGAHSPALPPLMPPAMGLEAPFAFQRRTSRDAAEDEREVPLTSVDLGPSVCDIDGDADEEASVGSRNDQSDEDEVGDSAVEVDVTDIGIDDSTEEEEQEEDRVEEFEDAEELEDDVGARTSGEVEVEEQNEGGDPILDSSQEGTSEDDAALKDLNSGSSTGGAGLEAAPSDSEQPDFASAMMRDRQSHPDRLRRYPRAPGTAEELPRSGVQEGGVVELSARSVSMHDPSGQGMVIVVPGPSTSGKITKLGKGLSKMRRKDLDPRYPSISKEEEHTPLKQSPSLDDGLSKAAAGTSETGIFTSIISKLSLRSRSRVSPSMSGRHRRTPSTSSDIPVNVSEDFGIEGDRATIDNVGSSLIHRTSSGGNKVAPAASPRRNFLKEQIGGIYRSSSTQTSLSSTTRGGSGDDTPPSRLECVVELLKGATAYKRRKLTRVAEVRVWISEDLTILHWEIGFGGGKADIPLATVRKLKGTYDSVSVEYGDIGEHVEFAFSSREVAARWTSGLSCLLPSSAQIRSYSWSFSQRNYNLFMDTWNGKPLLARKRVSEYILLGTIGRGAFGKVKLGISVRDKRFYAIKIISKAMIRKQNRTASFEAQAIVGSQLGIGDNREIAIMKKLNHPNILGLKEVFDDETQDNLYMVLEYMPGGSVMQSSKTTGADPLPEERCRSVFIQALSGIEYLHRNRIVHRDIKPDNLLCKLDGSIKLSDFGASKYYELDSSDSRSKEGNLGLGFVATPFKDSGRTAIGTPAFLAPELSLSPKAPPPCSNENYAADVWSLGATLFYLAYGRVPFLAESVFQMYDAICTQDITFPDKPPTSREFKDLVRLILERDPARRATARDIWHSPWIRDAMKHGECFRPNENINDIIRVTDDDIHGAVSSMKNLVNSNFHGHVKT